MSLAYAGGGTAWSVRAPKSPKGRWKSSLASSTAQSLLLQDPQPCSFNITLAKVVGLLETPPGRFSRAQEGIWGVQRAPRAAPPPPGLQQVPCPAALLPNVSTNDISQRKSKKLRPESSGLLQNSCNSAIWRLEKEEIWAERSPRPHGEELQRAREESSRSETGVCRAGGRRHGPAALRISPDQISKPEVFPFLFSHGQSCKYSARSLAGSRRGC